MRRLLPLLVLAAACHHSSSNTGDAGGSDGAVAHDGPSTPIDGAPQVACTPTSGTPLLTTQTVATGLDMPVFVTSPPNDPRLFVLEKRSGKIKIVKDGSVLASPFVTVPVISVSSLDDERGLLGLAFAPDYAQSGKFYDFYVNSDGNEEIDQYVVGANPDVADAASRTLVWSNTDFASNHNGGTLAFGPDGYLYFAVGDGGGGGDPMAYGQDIDVLFAKINRIDVSSLPYTSPATNPFAGSIPGADEIWDYGLRNPYRWSFDRQTGDIYVGDVGQGTYEEVDVLPHTSQGGLNLGWSVMEGNHCYNAATCNMTGKQTPIYEYSHSSGGCAVIGGYVYRGSCLPDYDGTYFFADYCNHWVRSLTWDGAGGFTNEVDQTNLGPGGDIVAFGQDAYGELYLVRQDTGEVQRIVAP